MQQKLLFVHSHDETFVRLDRDLLSASFSLQDFHVPYKFPVGLPRYLKFVFEADVVFCWFASWNAFWILFLARLLHKRSVLVIGGYDVACLPEAGYGHQRGGLNKFTSRLAMQLAGKLIPFSSYSLQEAQNNAGISPQRMQVVYIGVPDPFGSLPTNPRARMALTVGTVEWVNLKRKGQEPFVRAAQYLPEVPFVLVGQWKDDSIEHLRSIASPNVTFTGKVSGDELVEYYRCASVYVQVSLHEGFGLSVAEAMLAGCIPVVTKAGSLPEVVGNCGHYCKTNHPEMIAEVIQTALVSPDSDRFRARGRILSTFPLEKRRNLLQKLILERE